MPANLYPGVSIKTVDIVALVLVIVGGVNWGLVGLADVDLVAMLFGAGSALSRVIYMLVGVSAIYLITLVLRLANGPSTVPVRA